MTMKLYLILAWTLDSFGLMGLSGSGTPPGSPGKTRSNSRCNFWKYFFEWDFSLRVD